MKSLKIGFVLLLALCACSGACAATAAEYCDAGLRLNSEKNFSKALQYFNASIKQEPGNAAALLGRADCLYSLKLYNRALTDYKKIQALQPQNGRVNKLVQELQNMIDSAPKSITWRTPAEGLEESKRTGKPILYDITAEWCPQCVNLKKQVFDDKVCAERINVLYVPVRALDRMREERKNPKDVETIENRYRIRGFPTLVVQFPGKNVYKKIDAFGNKKRIMNFINRAVQ